MPDARRSTLSPVDAVWLALIAVVSAATLFVILQAPAECGAWQDDGIYLVTARSLARGEGYRRPELPGEPWQTKYPPLWPAVLALVWWIAPNFPDNVALMRTLSVTLSAAGGAAAYLLLRRAWRSPPWLAGLGVLTALINPAWTGLLKTPMSEPLFLLLTCGVLLVVTPASAEPLHEGRRGVLRGATGGLLAGAACLARSVGVGLLLIIPLAYALRRRWLAAGAALAVAWGVQGAWSAWKASARAANASHPASSALIYELDYGAWLPRSFGEAARVAAFNSVAGAYALFNCVVAPNERWVWESFIGPVATVPLYAGISLVTALTLAGLWGTWSAGRPALHLFLALYAAVVLVWPFPPIRFVAAILPIVNTALLAGLYLLVVTAVRLFDPEAATQPPLRSTLRDAGLAGHDAGGLSGAATARRAAALVSAALVLRAGVLLLDLRTVRDETWRASELEFVETMARVTPPDAVIACDNGGYYHVLTGRKFVLPLPIDDPIPLLYSDQRRIGLCGIGFTEAERTAVSRLVTARMLDYLRRAGVTYYVQPSEDSMFGGCRWEYVKRHTRWFPVLVRCDIASLHRFTPPE